MRRLAKILLLSVSVAQLAVLRVQAATTYQLDNNNISTVLNASDGTETLDNWFGNVFTILAGGNLVTSVDFGVYTTTPNSTADVVLYKVTGAGGNPALGASRIYTQAFTPLTGDGTNAFLQTINLTTPVLFNTGIAGWSSPVARQAHNLKVPGSNPGPATNLNPAGNGRVFSLCR
jgi:hypothetical protein